MIFLSTWATITDPTLPGGSVNVPQLLTLIPGQILQGTPSSARCAVSVSDPPDALLTDYRFPQLQDGVPVQFADYQAGMLAAVANWSAEQTATGFAFQGNQFPLDQNSKTSWHVVLTLTSALTFPVLVVTNNGAATVSMDQATAVACAQAALAAGLTIDQTAAGYVSAIAAATTIAQLDAITFD